MSRHQRIVCTDEVRNINLARELQFSLSRKWATSSSLIQYYWRKWKPARRSCCLRAAVNACGMNDQWVKDNLEGLDEKAHAVHRREQNLLTAEFSEMLLKDDFNDPECLFNALKDRTKSLAMQLSPDTDDVVGDLIWVQNHKSLARYHQNHPTAIKQFAFSRMILSMDILSHVVDGLLFAISIDYDEDDFKKFLDKRSVVSDLPSPESFELEEDEPVITSTTTGADTTATVNDQISRDGLVLSLQQHTLIPSTGIAPTGNVQLYQSELPPPLSDTRQPLRPQGIDYLLYLYRTEPRILSYTVNNWHSNRPKFDQTQEGELLTPGYSLDLFEVMHDAVTEAAMSAYIRDLVRTNNCEYQERGIREPLRRREIWNVYDEKFHRAQILFRRYYQSELEKEQELESNNLALLVKLCRTKVGEAVDLVETICKQPETLALMNEDEREAFNHLVDTVSLGESIRHWIGGNDGDSNNENFYLSKAKSVFAKLNKWKREFVKSRCITIEGLREQRNAIAALDDLNDFVMTKTHGKTMGHLYYEAFNKSLTEISIQIEMKKPHFDMYENGFHYKITPKRSTSTLPQEHGLPLLKVHEHYLKNVWQVLFGRQSEEGISFSDFRMAMEDVGFKVSKDYCGSGLYFVPLDHIKLVQAYAHEGLAIQEPYGLTFKNMALAKLAAFLRTRLGWDVGWFEVRPVEPTPSENIE